MEIDEALRAQQEVENFLRSAGIPFSKTIRPDDDTELKESTAKIVEKNKEIFNKLEILAKEKGITLKEALNTPQGDRLKGDLIINNMAAANELAKKAYNAGIESLKNAGVPNYMSKAISLEDWQQEFFFELAALANTWDPAVNPEFGAYIATKNKNQPIGKQQGLLAVRYGQILNRLKGKNLDAFSLAALEEKGFDPSVDTMMEEVEQEADEMVVDRLDLNSEQRLLS